MPSGPTSARRRATPSMPRYASVGPRRARHVKPRPRRRRVAGHRLGRPPSSSPWNRASCLWHGIRSRLVPHVGRPENPCSRAVARGHGRVQARAHPSHAPALRRQSQLRGDRPRHRADLPPPTHPRSRHRRCAGRPQRAAARFTHSYGGHLSRPDERRLRRPRRNYRDQEGITVAQMSH